MQKRIVIYISTILITLTCIPGDIFGQKILKQGSTFKVVINHEEQYSIWPLSEKTTKGWKDTRITGDLNKCREYIEEVWTDMRPLSIRKLRLPASTNYYVVINHEEQYSIWPEGRPLPKSWKKTDIQGSLSKCTAYIEEVWTDMRPLSLRKIK